MKAAREAWFEGQPDLDPTRLVFFDETWTSTNMARVRGRSPRGERLRSPVPHGHWKTTTFVAGLRLSGIAAPFVLDGPINRDAFQTYVERVLVPELAPGDVVVMDNLGRHTPGIVPCHDTIVRAASASFKSASVVNFRASVRRQNDPHGAEKRAAAIPHSDAEPHACRHARGTCASPRPQAVRIRGHIAGA